MSRRNWLLAAATGAIGCGGAQHKSRRGRWAKPAPEAKIVRWTGAAGHYQDELARAEGHEVALTPRADLQRATEAAPS